LGNPYDIIVSDKDGTASIEWGAYGVPESFLVYQNKIIKRFIGPINNEDLLEIQKIIR
jgi:cytochrome c biogenesis protein CcmG/thiol:disulfide interchange protein DsbE